MTTTAAKRPPLARKVTNDYKRKQDEALDQGVSLTIDGQTYTARVGDVTPEIARELRKHTGAGFMSLINTCSVDPDVDVISALLWVARRIAGENVDFLDVAVTYKQMLGDDFDVDVAGPEDVDDSPEG